MSDIATHDFIPRKKAGIDLLFAADGKVIVRSNGQSHIIEGLSQDSFMKIWAAIDGKTTISSLKLICAEMLAPPVVEAFFRSAPAYLFGSAEATTPALAGAASASERMIPLGEKSRSAVVRNTSDDEHAYRRVVIVGGGTAGYFAALAFRKLRPEIQVTLIESSSIPVIGVGEASTPVILSFLHETLGIDPVEFYREVHPTWKLGIRFDWGLPGDHHFYNPFGLCNFLEADHFNGSLDHCTLGTTLMMAGKGLIGRNAGGLHYSLLNQVGYAYHLENRALIAFLRKRIQGSGIQWMDRTVGEVRLNENGEIDAIVTDAGEILSFDLYIDCSGFRSLLLGKALQTKFIPFSKSLFTDRAVTGVMPVVGNPSPYTLAQTMQHGWNWNIPVNGENHRGYVHASDFCSVDEAIREMQALNPEITDFKEVRFRSGRHALCWNKNVVAIGNAYAFVEPLESTGLHMIIESIKTLLRNLPQRKDEHTAIKAAVNEKIALQWDYIKHFLAIHFKYNRKLDTPFWQHCRSETDVSGIAELLSLYREVAPLTTIADKDPEMLRAFIHDRVFGAHGFDYMLMGQGIRPGRQYRISPGDSDYPERKKQWLKLADEALSHGEALKLLADHPELISSII